MNIIRFHRTKCVQLFLLCLLILTFVVILIQSHYFTAIYQYIHPSESVACYKIKSPSLPDILEDEPSKGRSIFFHETSCKSYVKGRISINSRQACAVESAARMNPNMDVYLLYTSPGVIEFRGDESDRFLRVLTAYKNVKLKHIDFERYSNASPIEELYRSGSIARSGYPQSHASDVLRYLTLWKYGGIYLDLDVIVIKSLERYAPNFAGSESDKNVAAGVLSFSWDGLGHELARTCLDDLKYHFNGQDWGYNGPGVITRLLRRICGAEEAKDMVNQNCQGFRVYPKNRFYAVPWPNWKMYFDEGSTEVVFNVSKDSSVVHVWNKHSSSTRIPLGSQVPYLIYAKKHCPNVVQECKEFF